jgi:hypothetical protein
MIRREMAGWALMLVASAIGVILSIRLHTANSGVDRLDSVCKLVRERLCLTRESIGHRDQLVAPPTDIEIDACAPGVRDGLRLDEAVKNNTYEAELRSQVESEIAAIPTAYDAAHDPCLFTHHWR